MGKTFDVDQIYFDSLTAGVTSEIDFDASMFFDNPSSEVVSITMGIDFETESYISSDTLDLFLELGIETIENYSKFVDLLQLVPEKFRDSTVLQQFLDETGMQTGT